MKYLPFFLIVIATAFIAGCLPTSVHPLYTEEDIVFDNELLGMWYDPDEPVGDTWLFKRWGRDSYRLQIHRGHGIGDVPVAEFDVVMARIGEETFLDFFPREPEDMDDFYNLHLVPTHSFCRIKITEDTWTGRDADTLWIGLFELEWLEENLESGKVNLKHEERDDMIVLTASTFDLQEFVKKYWKEAFPITEDSRLIRGK
ncbi:MAG: hypothetical protein GWO41_12400 [candidate division Zixibacteria bacterium]|nr:hypothetical protein [candidate division Zixibacteria bacterium]NIR66068.1 hypothetical protein [candidate division Zixibacteria bacterium]NIS17152.1 hypothetical protein [candidate division Zixibacteria bacterium]NIS47698.1 hypothetical protein [candidate division Zixibacteria bacterium]NIT53507.1 hypothetical protein [candidate division Zixibacteria bacterium]